jgi:imidazolonepropionase-like amidohydrolase
MPSSFRTVALATLVLGAPPLAGEIAAQVPARSLALTGATIYPAPDRPAIANGVIFLREGRIAAVGRRGEVTIPPGTDTLDCTGLTIAAGFWNSHVHFGERKWARAAELPAAEASEQLRQMLTSHGFTHVFDTGSPLGNTLALRGRIAAGEVEGPAILTAGDIIWPKGGVPPLPVMAALGFITEPQDEVATADEAAARARERLEAGADAVKVYAATWMDEPVVMPRPVIAAAAKEAHARGKLLVAHPSNAAGLEAALAAGADVLVHTAPAMETWSDSLVRRMVEAEVALVPTLKLWRYEARSARLAFSRPFVQAGVDQLRAFHRAGGTVLFGTDVGYMLDYDTTEEFVLMARAGLSFAEILASLTTNPAHVFGLEAKAGRIAPGAEADLIVLDGDPARDIRSLARVRYTLRRGRIIYTGSESRSTEAACCR